MMAELYDQTCPTLKPRRFSDRISDLSDDIIVCILSLVPTKQAVATSILSKRWLPIWTLVPVLDLEDSPRSTQKSLAEFVDKFFQFNKAEPLVKLHLKSNPGYGWCIPNCIRTATERGALQELDISLPPSSLRREMCRFSSISFNEILMLKVLKLGYGIILDVPSGISFPNLKTLHLVLVDYKNKDSAGNLFSACLVLEELFVKRSPNDFAVYLNISISTLKSLSLERLQEHLFEINAPVLEYLDLKDIDFDTYRPDSRDQSCLFEVFCSVKSLTFTSMNRGYDLGRNYCNLLFVNLVRLELNVGFKNWDLLMLFLQNSHILRVLQLTLSELNVRSIKYQNHRRKLPDHVPICFLSSLEKVCFRKFSAFEHELQLIEYILTNARLLKTITICGDDFFLDSYVQKKLSIIPRCSKSCQLQFKSQSYFPFLRHLANTIFPLDLLKSLAFIK